MTSPRRRSSEKSPRKPGPRTVVVNDSAGKMFEGGLGPHQAALDMLPDMSFAMGVIVSFAT